VVLAIIWSLFSNSGYISIEFPSKTIDVNFGKIPAKKINPQSKALSGKMIFKPIWDSLHAQYSRYRSL
jgi:hypothetical protein